MAGPTIEWLEPKLPDLLKNGSGSLGSFATEEGALEGNRLELNSTEFSSFSGVRAQKQKRLIHRLQPRCVAETIAAIFPLRNKKTSVRKMRWRMVSRTRRKTWVLWRRSAASSYTSCPS